VLERNALEDISRFNYKYSKLLVYLHVPTTIFHKINYSAETCACIWRCYERGHNITLSMDLSPVRGQYFILSVGSIFYVLIPSPDFLVILDANCMYLVRLWILCTYSACNLNFEWSFWAFVLIRLVIQPTIYCTWGEHAKRPITESVLFYLIYFVCFLVFHVRIISLLVTFCFVYVPQLFPVKWLNNRTRSRGINDL
jgi:hypothetical protein